jgi:hypothetical protein
MPPDLQPTEWSSGAWNGLTPGACGLPFSSFGTNRLTAMPMFS